MSCRVVAGVYTEATHDFGAQWSVDQTPYGGGSNQQPSMDAVSCPTVWHCVAVGYSSAVSSPSGTQSFAGAEVTEGGGAFPGYWLAASDGGVFSFGQAGFHGSTGNLRLNSPVVGIASTPDAGGYWLVAADGGVFSFGNARFFGSMGGRTIAGRVVGIVSAPGGDGYAMATSQGAIYGFGSYVSLTTSPSHPASPVVGIASHGSGAWMATADGTVIPIGADAATALRRENLYPGGRRPNARVVGIASGPDGGIYVVTANGGVFCGSADFQGSAANLRLARPIVGITVPDSGGYWLVARDGGVFSFGDGNFYGSTGALRLNKPIVGIS